VLEKIARILGLSFECIQWATAEVMPSEVMHPVMIKMLARTTKARKQGPNR
jgi:hypothetical protein